MSNYSRGVFWFILCLLVGILNDVCAKHLGQSMHPTQITFLRFFFGTLSLLPFMFARGRGAFHTKRVPLHVLRGLILFVAIALWCFGLTQGPIVVATTMTFTIPIFTLILASIFLKEAVGFKRWIPTLLGFLGVFVVLNPESAEFTLNACWLLVATVLFALLDVVNKKYVSKESTLTMLFYTALITTIISAIPAAYKWVTPTMQELFLLALLGCGANLILFSLLKAFTYVEVSAVAPFRYLELIFSLFFGLTLFEEMPAYSFYMGALIIIPATLSLVYLERVSRKVT